MGRCIALALLIPFIAASANVVTLSSILDTSFSPMPKDIQRREYDFLGFSGYRI
jgi:hypothetical protein